MLTLSSSKTLSFAQVRTYLLSLLFVVGNILMPQICHLVPGGGLVWLPIYFFTLVGAYAYGWRVGLITAIASPLLNSLIFGMPALGVLPAILVKSALLAMIAGVLAGKYPRVTLLSISAVVLGYQAIGTIGEWAICGDLLLALQDLRIGLPGILVQIFGGYAIVKWIQRIG